MFYDGVLLGVVMIQGLHHVFAHPKYSKHICTCFCPVSDLALALNLVEALTSNEIKGFGTLQKHTKAKELSNYCRPKKTSSQAQPRAQNLLPGEDDDSKPVFVFRPA